MFATTPPSYTLLRNRTVACCLVRATGLAFHYIHWDSSDSAPIVPSTDTDKNGPAEGDNSKSSVITYKMEQALICYEAHWATSF